MACYRPVDAWVPLKGGPICFSEKKDCRQVKIPCRQCIGCRIQRQEQWATRCYAESRSHDRNSFVTLTYDDAHLPPGGTLRYRDVQLFLKRARKALGPFRYFIAGEYGEQFSRPHYHALLFGLDFPDAYPSNGMHSEFRLYRSPRLETLWTLGTSSIGEVNYATARYCASYVLQAHRKTGPDDPHYKRYNSATGEIYEVEPEFAQMSRRPGIGAAWLEKYWRDLYVAGHHGVIINGSRKSIPKYFDTLLERIDPFLKEQLAYEREKRAEPYLHDQTPDRLAVRETVEIARRKFNLERKL